MAGIELDRVETLLRERSAEMTRTKDPASIRRSLDGPTLEIGVPAEPAHVVEVSHEGACVDCGDRILSARLKAMPGAVRCLVCQRRLESQTG